MSSEVGTSRQPSGSVSSIGGSLSVTTAEEGAIAMGEAVGTADRIGSADGGAVEARGSVAAGPPPVAAHAFNANATTEVKAAKRALLWIHARVNTRRR
jgi:Iap family predicted aminopeptidase